MNVIIIYESIYFAVTNVISWLAIAVDGIDYKSYLFSEAEFHLSHRVVQLSWIFIEKEKENM